MFCRNCGQPVDEKAVACTKCGVSPMAESKFCHNCGAPTQSNQAVCTKCGVSLGRVVSGAKNKVTAGLLGIFLGGFGVHKFYLGYTKEGVIMLVIWLVGLLPFGLGALVMSIIGLVEGIIYLTKSDPEFDLTYVRSKKGWF